jgi:hypothetical protein
VWFDCFSIDEHATQALPQEWWGTTFREAIQLLEHTVMLLSPWDTPVVLTRAWCLWELFCSVDTGVAFSVCLGPVEQAAFEAALLADSQVLMDAFAHIDVATAEAGSPADRAMIMAAVERMPGGCRRLNAVAMAEMRAWVRSVLARMEGARRDLPWAVESFTRPQYISLVIPYATYTKQRLNDCTAHG